MQFKKLNPGSSVKGNPIPAYKSVYDSDKYFYILGAVHGDEVEGAHLANMLFSWLENDFNHNLPIIVVPVVNVDGFNAKTRVNANGVDLNRNLPSKQWTAEAREPKYYPGKEPLSEPENQFLVELFKKFPPRFIISFHSWYPVINYNGACKEVAEYLASYNKYPIEADFASHPTPGSLGEYGPQQLRCPVLTFECPLLSDSVTLESIWEENKEGFTKLFSEKVIENFKS